MELKFPENIKEIVNGIYYRFSEKFGLNYHSQPVFSHLCPFFCLFAPPPQKKKKCILHLRTIKFYIFSTVGTI